MKYMKYLLVLALATFAIVSQANAQASIQILGGGSSALFLELGEAAVSGAGGTNVACTWTQGKNANILARDARTATPTDEQGNIWIVWTKGTGSCATPAGAYNIWAYMSLDSTIGNRCYFEVDSSGTPGCVQVLTIAPTTAGANLLCYPSLTTCTNFGDYDGVCAGKGATTCQLSSTVETALNGQHFFVAGTDILPLDAKFATLRLLTNCGAPIYRQAFDQILRQTYGLGYGPGPVGTNIQSSYTTSVFHVLDFNITGNDPINTTLAVPAYTVSTVGAQPIVVVVGPNDTSGNGLNLAYDVPMYVLQNFFDGTLGLASDFPQPLTGTQMANWPVTTHVREALSGTYNTFEWSAVNNSQFHSSQDAFNCSGTSVSANPMTLVSKNGVAGGGGGFAYRKRVIGTGEMTKYTNLATDTDYRLGYFFWSAGNAAGLTNTKYITVNGVDPIENSYTNGTLPGSGGPGDPGIGAVTFKNLNQGDYPIWSALRLISRGTGTTAVGNLITSLQGLQATLTDMITLANLKVWHSHYYIPAIGSNVSANGATINPLTPNDLCNPTGGALAETGGDAGGANILKVANFDFCSDFGNNTGLINKTE
jgi:hypothetical protein